MRVACLHISGFPLAAWCRVEPDLRGRPVVVTAGTGSRARVIACSPEAMQRGIHAGLTAAQSVAMVANLVVRPASADAEGAAQAALCDAADAFSARVEVAEPGIVYLDCAGSMALFGSEAKLGMALSGA